MNLKSQSESLRQAYAAVADAQQRLCKGVAEMPFAPLLEALARKAEDIDRQITERRARFDAVPILQAELRFRDGKTRKVAVSKPNDEIDEPHIGEIFYSALQKQGVVASCEAWPVLVVDRRGRVVGKIDKN